MPAPDVHNTIWVKVHRKVYEAAIDPDDGGYWLRVDPRSLINDSAEYSLGVDGAIGGPPKNLTPLPANAEVADVAPLAELLGEVRRIREAVEAGVAARTVSIGGFPVNAGAKDLP